MQSLLNRVKDLEVSMYQNCWCIHSFIILYVFHLPEIFEQQYAVVENSEWMNRLGDLHNASDEGTNLGNFNYAFLLYPSF